ncbi:MAG: hypothetical protein LBS63_02865 [Prevotellaceae bacterium]|jgi:hypothetical protein|nr:hypothetical protein [Prevotellaceae bacterium]
MKTKTTIVAIAAIIAGVTLSGCGGSKEVAGVAPGKTKRVKDECQLKALEKDATAWRSWGTGSSAKESFATNLAELDARTKLARQLTVQINGFIRSFNQQHTAGAAAGEVGKASEVQQAYVDKLLTGTRVICTNAYDVAATGQVEVFVCVEMDESAVAGIVKKISDEKKLAIDFAERQFLDEMKKAKEDFRASQEE